MVVAKKKSKKIQYVSDDNGKPTAIIVPMELWNEISCERETAYLLKSKTMTRRLKEAMSRQGGVTLDETREKFGI